MKPQYKYSLLLLFVSPLWFSGCADSKPFFEQRYGLGTTLSVKLYNSPQAKKNAEEYFDLIFHFENLFSRNRSGSDISLLNRSAGNPEGVSVAPETIEMLQESFRFTRLTGGLFDVTLGPLVDLWGIGTGQSVVPEQTLICGALALRGLNFLSLDPEGTRATLLRPDMVVEPGGIAKGFICDKAAEKLRSLGETSALLNLGGNIYALGEKPDGTPFLVGIQDPFGPRGRSIGTVQVRNRAVVTSGIYERFFEKDGIRYHHILDPKTGFPVENGLAAVSVVTPRGTDGDGLSTSLFLLGIEKGAELVAQFPDTQALFITRKGTIYLTPGMDQIFTLTSPDFTMESTAQYNGSVSEE